MEPEDLPTLVQAVGAQIAGALRPWAALEEREMARLGALEARLRATEQAPPVAPAGVKADLRCPICDGTQDVEAFIQQFEDRTYLRITEQEYQVLPLDILIQVFVALVLTCYGVISWKLPSLKEIRANADTEHKTWESFGNRSSSYVFSHRGRAVFQTNVIEQR